MREWPTLPPSPPEYQPRIAGLCQFGERRRYPLQRRMYAKPPVIITSCEGVRNANSPATEKEKMVAGRIGCDLRSSPQSYGKNRAGRDQCKALDLDGHCREPRCYGGGAPSSGRSRGLRIGQAISSNRSATVVPSFSAITSRVDNVRLLSPRSIWPIWPRCMPH